MLGYLKGSITAHLGGRCLIQVNNTGYWLQTGAWQPSGEVEVYLHHHVREDISDLYAFEVLDDLELFEALITISGIGPKAALALLSLGSDSVRTAIATEDTALLKRAPGVGLKAAQKVILELKNTPHARISTQAGGDELLMALESLGYKQHEILPLLKLLPIELTDLNTQLRWALKQLS